MFTDFFAADDIEATARRTGFVQRTSKLTGKLFLALMTFGAWSEAKTTLAQLAAKATQLSQPVDISPEAIHQRMHKPAIAFLQDMIRQTLAKLSSLDPICDDGLFPSFPKVYIADSTGFALPEELHQTFPGAGGSAAKAGAKIQAHSTEFSGGAPTPFMIPLKLCSLTPIVGHHLHRPSDQRMTHAQHRSPAPRKPDDHHRFPE